jgi:excisionase family DNA binding protein
MSERREDLLTVKEFASRVRVHPQTVWRWIRAGRMDDAVRVVGRRTIRIHYPTALKTPTRSRPQSPSVYLPL